VIVEAPASSGALITAQFALDQGRDLWVASVGAHSPLGAGTGKLAEEGGRVIFGAGDILAEWGIAYTEREIPAQDRDKGETGSLSGTALGVSLARALDIELSME
jgi:DNA processing protein